MLTPTEIRERLTAAKPNSIFSARFIKRDGTERTMRCRLGVRKHLKGGTLSYDPAAVNNLIVFDMERGAYRTIPFDRILELRVSGETFNFEETV